MRAKVFQRKLMRSLAGGWRATFIFMTLLGAFAMPPKPAAAAMPPALYRLGLPAAAGAVSVTVSSADVSPDPQDGQALRVVVRYTVKNISYDPVPVTDIPRLGLLDPNGEAHDPVETAAETPSSDAGLGAALAPGAELSRMAAFTVAKDRFNAATWLLLVGGPSGPRITLQ
jgi:hypothetical protein